MAIRKNAAASVDETDDVDYAPDTAENVAAEPAPVKKERTPRAPKPVTDLASANVAFNKAKRAAERTEKAADDAIAARDAAQQTLTNAATELKRYTADIDAAANAVLSAPESAEDPTEVA